MLRTHMNRLRAKIEPAGGPRRHYIRTETCLGYRFDPKHRAEPSDGDSTTTSRGQTSPDE